MEMEGIAALEIAPLQAGAGVVCVPMNFTVHTAISRMKAKLTR
jgi:hypothetical protein